MITFKTQDSFDLCFKTQNLFSLSFQSAGCIRSKSDWSHRKQTLECFELILVVEGNLHIQANYDRYTVNENEILILSPYTTFHGYRTEKESTSFYWCRFMTDDLTKFGIEKTFISVADIAEIQDLFIHLASLSAMPEHSQILPELLISLILTEIGIAEKSENKKDTKISSEIANLIQENGGLITPEQVAEHFGYNKDYISKLFKSAYGMTIKEYSNKIKIQNAKNLLVTSAYTIKQIALSLGFENNNLFIKFFKYHENITPTQFRNTYKTL